MYSAVLDIAETKCAEDLFLGTAFVGCGMHMFD